GTFPTSSTSLSSRASSTSWYWCVLRITRPCGRSSSNGSRQHRVSATPTRGSFSRKPPGTTPAGTPSPAARSDSGQRHSGASAAPSVTPGSVRGRARCRLLNHPAHHLACGGDSADEAHVLSDGDIGDGVVARGDGLPVLRDRRVELLIQFMFRTSPTIREVVAQHTHGVPMGPWVAPKSIVDGGAAGFIAGSCHHL